MVSVYLKTFFRKFVVFQLILSLFYCELALSQVVTIQLNQGRTLRQKSDSFNYLRKKEVLPRGTTLQVPLSELTDAQGINRYKKMNKQEREKAVIHWLKNPKFVKLQTFGFRKSGKPKRDYYLKVSKENGEEGFMQLKTLALKGNLDIVTTEDAAFYEDEPARKIAQRQIGQSRDQGSPYGLTDDQRNACHERTRVSLPEQMYNLFSKEAMDASEIVLADIERKRDHELRRTTPQDTIDNINSDKHGCDYWDDQINIEYCSKSTNVSSKPTDCMDSVNKIPRFDKLKDILKHEADKHSVPYDMLLSLISQESSGRCMIQANDGGLSTGLFQINILNSLDKELVLRFCPEARKCKDLKWDDYNVCKEKAIRNHCREKLLVEISNPVVNIELAIELLKRKFKRTNGMDPFTTTGGKSFSKLDPILQDMWRSSISAYHGGERHVHRAKKEIEIFNKENGTNLDSRDWNTRRAFILKRLMSANYANMKNKSQENIGEVCDNFFHGYQSVRNSSRAIAKDLGIAGDQVDAFGTKNTHDRRSVCFSRLNASYVDSVLGRNDLEARGRSRIDDWNSALGNE